jgi:penicillin-binding protein 1A
MPNSLKAGDVLAAAPVRSGVYAVRTVPEVAGGLAVESVGNGRVLALQGGFDSGLGSFNRATQANRQPGSTIKPFVYATGLDNGLTPASLVLDGQFCVYQGARYGQKCFRNFGGAGGAGDKPMRWGLEQSRNLMTVRIANDSGIERVVKTFKDVGIGEHEPYLSSALGAGDTTVLKMVNAYAALANNGIQYEPTVIDYVQDRNGKVIWKADKRRCVACDMDEWDGKPMPRLDRRGKQVMDPRTAFQTVHMLQGVVIRGTATILRDLKLPLFGKTGTTTGPTNVWFVGGSQKYVAGVYLGFDQPRNMGGYAQGGTYAAPVVKKLIEQTKSRWSTLPFRAPPGIRMVKIDRLSGKRVSGATVGDDPKAAVIWEAFKPDTEPRRKTNVDEFVARRDALIAEVRRARSPRSAVSNASDSTTEIRDFAEEQGGVY